jgi:hypothetical protein
MVKPSCAAAEVSLLSSGGKAEEIGEMPGSFPLTEGREKKTWK